MSILNTVYMATSVTSTNMRLQENDVVTMAAHLHEQAMNLKFDEIDFEKFGLTKPNPREIKTYEDSKKVLGPIKRSLVPAFWCSNFGSPLKKTGSSLVPRAKSKRDSSQRSTLRDYIVVDYDFEPGEDKKMQEAIISIREKLAQATYITYPTISFAWAPRFRLIVLVNQVLDEYNYVRGAKALIDYIGVDPGDSSNLSSQQGQLFPFYTHPQLVEESIIYKYNDVDKLFDLKTIYKIKDEPVADKKTRKEGFIYKPEPFLGAFKKMVELDSFEKDFFGDYQSTFITVSALAAMTVKGEIDTDTGEEACQILAMGDPDWVEGNIKKYHELLKSYEEKGDDYEEGLRHHVSKSKNFVYISGEKIKPGETLIAFISRIVGTFDEDLDFETMGNHLLQSLEYAVWEDRPGSIEDRLAIFDPSKGVWVSDPSLFKAIASVAIPGINLSRVDALNLHLATRCMVEGRIISGYTGSQFIVFKNGVLDMKSGNSVQELKLLDLGSPEVKNIHLTSRNRLNIDWDPSVEPKVFKKIGYEDGDWSIDSYLRTYGYNDEEKYELFMFLISLGLFGGHTSGVAVSLVGGSGDGKSSLFGWFQNLYEISQTEKIAFPDVNKQFPLTRYSSESTLLWVQECNLGMNKLEESTGVVFYDGFCDPLTVVDVKHKPGSTIKPGPMYVDGTATIAAEEITTGPARRTIVFKLPENMSTDEVKKKYYSVDLSGMQRTETNLIYFVREAIGAFLKYVPIDRRSNFKLNMSTKADQQLFPSCIQEWREEIVMTDVDLKRFFEDRIWPYHLKIDDFGVFDSQNEIEKNLSTEKLIYDLYLVWLKDEDPRENASKFAKKPDKVIKSVVSNFEKMGYERIWYGSSVKNGVDRDGNQRFRVRTGFNFTCLKNSSAVINYGLDWMEYGDRFDTPTDMGVVSQTKECFFFVKKNIKVDGGHVDEIRGRKFFVKNW